MNTLLIIAGVYLSMGLLYWLRMVVGVIRVRRAVPKLGQPASPEPERWPRLSVVIPACDEADKIEPAARTLIEQDYPDLQLVFVNDRSGDATGAIMDRLAAAHENVRVVHVIELPAGWLGKVHALQQGLAASDGEYVLFTDADVHFAPDALREAMTHMLGHSLDHLAACPALWATRPIVDALIAAFLRQLLAFGMPPYGVSDRSSPAYFGVGAFNLLRREAFCATQGFDWLRMETADDMGVALMMKRSGASCGVVAAFEQVGLEWHRSIGEAARSAEKAFASIGNCRVWRIVVAAALVSAMEFAPAVGLIALVVQPAGWVGLLGAGVVGLFAASSLPMARWTGGPVLAALATPAVAPLAMVVMLRVAWLGWRQGGIAWRGTVYASKALRAGRRVKPGL